MEYVWNMHGLCMEYARNIYIYIYIYGICKKYVWNMQEICMEYAWNMYGICKESVDPVRGNAVLDHFEG